MAIKEGQRYYINSFHLGFTNMETVELLATVVEVDFTMNGITLEPGLPPEGFPNKTFFAILRWFRDEYPAIKKGTLVLNNLAAFSKLVELGIAVLDG
jgi:hypothetical protein